jgi:hypothetical protein
LALVSTPSIRSAASFQSGGQSHTTLRGRGSPVVCRALEGCATNALKPPRKPRTLKKRESMIFSGAAESFKTLNPAGSDQAWEIFLKQ